MSIVLLAFLASFLPALLWLVFIYRRDRFEPEPKMLIARLFLWGLAAGPWASGMNILIAHVFSPPIDAAQRQGAFLLAALLLFALVALSALNEEVMKYVVVSSRVRGDPAFNEPVDGIIYMSTAAIGFSAGENVVYILNTYFGLLSDTTRPGVALALINAFLVTAPLRALLSTIGHITWSGIVGWFLSRHHLGNGSGRMLVGGILLAASFHTAYNFPLFLQELGLGVGWITWLVWIAGIERYLTLLGRALHASPFRAKRLEAMGEAAMHKDVLRSYRALRARQLPLMVALVALGLASAAGAALVGLPQEVPYTSAFAFILAAIAYSRFNWRCPVCGAHLSGSNPERCTHCHVALR
ncbi:MAG TPA: PrsW family glutamic-type intramembrane protease [Candidatus Limnocylindria bacterium]|nr:PrsW family glutamic-type intramembrane protease [Candidatus Limnocylindria bacterium]